MPVLESGFKQNSLKMAAVFRNFRFQGGAELLCSARYHD